MAGAWTSRYEAVYLLGQLLGGQHYQGTYVADHSMQQGLQGAGALVSKGPVPCH